jgi:membrane protein
VEVALRAGRAYGRDRCAIFAAGVTYYSLISLFPLALFAVSVLAFFVTNPNDQARVVDELMNALPLAEQDGRGALEQAVRSVVNGRGALGLIGFVGTAYAASALFSSVRVALNAVFHVEQQRPFVVGKSIDLGLVVGFGLLLLMSVALTAAIAVAQREAESLVGPGLSTLVAWVSNLGYLLVPPLVTSLVFLLLYTTVAHVGYTVRQVLPGVAVAALLFEGLKVGFAYYVASFGNYDATYGALGFVVVLLLFFNLSAQVMLLGAEVARANVERLELEQNGRPYETVLRTRRAAAALLEHAHRWPLVGRLIPRDRAGELIELLEPDADEGPAPSLEPPAPVPMAAPTMRAASGDPRARRAPGDEEAQGVWWWLSLTAVGVLLAGWFSGRER